MRRLAWLSPLAVVVVAGCFATRNDVRLLQADIARMQTSTEEARRADAERARAAQSHSDSLNASQMKQMLTMLRLHADSISALADQFSRFSATQHGVNYDTQQQLATIQETLGASGKSLADIRAKVEARSEERRTAGPPAAGGAADSSGAMAPTARVMYNTGMDALAKGSPSTARSAFEEMLKEFPGDSLSADATFQIAESYTRESLPVMADSVYGEVVRQFPKSPRAPSALYKRAVAVESSQPAAAKLLYRKLIQDYPKADEVRLARDHLSRLPPG